MNKTIATLFSGGGGFDLGSIACGYTPIFGIDNNADAVECYKRNIGDHIVLGDVRSHDYSGIKANHLHASPSCKTSSSANANKGETDFDIECAEAVCRAIAQIQPDTFSLENVEGYFKTESFQMILDTLWNHGFIADYSFLNSANFGVPQTRKRLIFIGSRITQAHIPSATHSEKPNLSQTDLFGTQPLKPWVSWYEAIADLIPTLQESKLADWQLRKLPNEIKESFMIDCRTSEGAFSMTVRNNSAPGFTITSTQLKGMPKIFLLESTGARSDRPLQYRTATEPSWTIRALGQDSHYHKANVLERGKVYVLDTRCLARLMSVPDSYVLPDRNCIAGMILGNMVPPLLAEAVMESFENV